jgi:hypothetical protein
VDPSFIFAMLAAAYAGKGDQDTGRAPVSVTLDGYAVAFDRLDFQVGTA